MHVQTFLELCRLDMSSSEDMHLPPLSHELLFGFDLNLVGVGLLMPCFWCGYTRWEQEFAVFVIISIAFPSVQRCIAVDAKSTLIEQNITCQPWDVCIACELIPSLMSLESTWTVPFAGLITRLQLSPTHKACLYLWLLHPLSPYAIYHITTYLCIHNCA